MQPSGDEKHNYFTSVIKLLKPIAIKIGPFRNSGDSSITTSLIFRLSFSVEFWYFQKKTNNMIIITFSTFPSVELIISKRRGYLLVIKTRYVVTQTIKRKRTWILHKNAFFNTKTIFFALKRANKRTSKLFHCNHLV